MGNYDRLKQLMKRAECGDVMTQASICSKNIMILLIIMVFYM